MSTFLSGARLQKLPSTKYWWVIALVSVLAGLLVGLVGQVSPGTLDAQYQVDLWLNATGNATLDKVAAFAGEVYSPKFAIAITLGASLLVWLSTKSLLNGIAISAITAFGWLPAQLFKFVIDEGRPDQSLLARAVVAPETDNAFPSGHTCFAIAFGYALFLLFRETRFKNLVLVLWLASVAIMAWARTYSGVHYPTDVLGSLFSSVAGLAALGFFWNRGIGWLAKR